LGLGDTSCRHELHTRNAHKRHPLHTRPIYTDTGRQWSEGGRGGRGKEREPVQREGEEGGRERPRRVASMCGQTTRSSPPPSSPPPSSPLPCGTRIPPLPATPPPPPGPPSPEPQLSAPPPSPASAVGAVWWHNPSFLLPPLSPRFTLSPTPSPPKCERCTPVSTIQWMCLPWCSPSLPSSSLGSSFSSLQSFSSLSPLSLSLSLSAS
jgi:hypothetical protein